MGVCLADAQEDLASVAGLAGCSARQTTPSDLDQQDDTMTDRTPRYFNDDDELTSDVNNQNTTTGTLVADEQSISETIHGATGGMSQGWRTQAYSAPLSGTWEKLSVDSPAVSAGTSGSWDDTEVEEPGVIYDDDGELKMTFSGTNGTKRSIGLATTTPDSIDDWTKDANNPVIDPDDYAAIGSSEIRNGSLLKLADGTYINAVCTIDNSGGNVHLMTSTDLVNWSHGHEVTETTDGSGNVRTCNIFQIGVWYYMMVQYDNQDVWLYSSRQPLTDWTRHRPVPIRSSSKDIHSTPAPVVLGNEIYFQWEEYNDNPTGTTIWTGSMQTTKLMNGYVEEPTVRSSQLQKVDNISSTSSTPDDLLPQTIVDFRGNSPVKYNSAVRVQAVLNAPTGETLTLELNSFGTGSPIYSVTSNSGANDQEIDSGWIEWPGSAPDSDRIFFKYYVSGGTSASINYCTVDVNKMPEIQADPNSPHVGQAGGSGAWDEGQVREGYPYYFGGDYIYSFYEGRQADQNPPSQIGVVRTPLK